MDDARQVGRGTHHVANCGSLVRAAHHESPLARIMTRASKSLVVTFGGIPSNDFSTQAAGEGSCAGQTVAKKCVLRRREFLYD